MTYHAWSLPVSVLFCIYGIIIARHAFSIKQTRDPEVLAFINETTWVNELLLAGLFFASGALWPFIYVQTGASETGIELLYVVATVILYGVSANWWAQGTFNHFRCKRDHAEKQRRLDEEAAIIENFRGEQVYSMSVDLKRKFLHLLPGLVIIVVELASLVMANDGSLVVSLGITRKAFVIFGETLIAYLFVFMIGYADMLRLAAFHQLPRYAKRWFFSSIKKAEARSFVSSCSLVLTLTPFLFAPVQVFVSVAFVSSLADAAAGLIGHKFGRRTFPPGSPKTEAGYLAGTGSAFLVVVCFSLLFNTSGMTVAVIFSIAAAASATFFFIDAFGKDLSDNILNPLLTGASMLVVLALL